MAIETPEKPRKRRGLEALSPRGRNKKGPAGKFSGRHVPRDANDTGQRQSHFRSELKEEARVKGVDPTSADEPLAPVSLPIMGFLYRAATNQKEAHVSGVEPTSANESLMPVSVPNAGFPF